jgi:hypothetical protein
MKYNFIGVVMTKSRQLLLSAFFLLSVVCISNQSAQAQSLQPPTQSFNWKSSEDSRNILLAQITVLNQQMPGIAPGTPLYDNTVRRIAYFKAIIDEIGKGAEVSQALELAVPAAATLGFEKEASYTPKMVLRALQTETRVLLTN